MRLELSLRSSESREGISGISWRECHNLEHGNLGLFSPETLGVVIFLIHFCTIRSFTLGS